MLRGLLSAKPGSVRPSLFYLFHRYLIPLCRTNVGNLWLESYLVVRDYRAGISVLASIILDSLGFERHILPVKAHQQIVVLQPKLRQGHIYAHKSELL